MSKQRNPVARHASILRKGGVHQKSKTGQRHHHRQETGDEAEAYFQQRQASRNKVKEGADGNCPDDAVFISCFTALQTAA
jgi:hypothetical protein